MGAKRRFLFLGMSLELTEATGLKIDEWGVSTYSLVSVSHWSK